MIGTIGSLVQVASKRSQWLSATTLYVLGCTSTAALLGGLLGQLGSLLHPGGPLAAVPAAKAAVGLIAIAYSASDLGILRLPRPHLSPAVPVTWWRNWNLHVAALAYGGSLGLGISTRISFGSFYVLCIWATMLGNPVTASLLLATYGASRSLIMFPISWLLVRPSDSASDWLQHAIFNIQCARASVAFPLTAFGTLLLLQSLLHVP